MAEEKYVLVSLEDERAGKIAEALGNKTCKKILDLLSEKELSESEIAKQLSLPLNTADYNVKKLVKSGFIEEKKHLWSSKGKRIPVYKISNKHIVISPKKTFPSQLKSIFPVVFISALFTAFILWYNKAREVVSENAEKMLAIPEVQIAEGARGAVSAFKLGTLEIFLVAIWIIVIIFVILTLRSERRFK